MRVTPLANEIASSRRSKDCQGKKGNVGLSVVFRAIAKLAELLIEEEMSKHPPPHDDEAAAESRGLSLGNRIEELPSAPEGADHRAELADVTSTLCSMILDEVETVWWKDIRSLGRCHSQEEDIRVRCLVNRLMDDPSPVVGVVGHSLLFQRIMKLFWPADPLTQAVVRAGLQNGSPDNGVDPLTDKVMNCGVLVLTFRRFIARTRGSKSVTEIVGSEFLFGGGMETARHDAGENVEDDPELGPSSECDSEAEDWGDELG